MTKNIRVIAINGLMQSGKTTISNLLSKKYNFNHFEIDKIIKKDIYTNEEFIIIIKKKKINILNSLNQIDYWKITKFIKKDKNKDKLNKILKKFVINYIYKNTSSDTIIIDAWNAYYWWEFKKINYFYLIINKTKLHETKYIKKDMISNIIEYQKKQIKRKLKKQELIKIINVK